MNLRYILIGLDFDTFPSMEFKEFLEHTRFISNFLSLGVRKLKFQTDGTFSMIAITLVDGPHSPPRIAPNNVITVCYPFDRTVYNRIKGSEDCEFYLQLLERGFKEVATFKSIPLSGLLSLIEEFRAGGYKNEWRHKKFLFRDLDLSVTLDCSFTTNDFLLKATIQRLSDKRVLFEEPILRTPPDEVYFEKEFKNVIYENGKLILTDWFDKPKTVIPFDVGKVLFGLQSE